MGSLPSAYGISPARETFEKVALGDLPRPRPRTGTCSASRDYAFSIALQQICAPPCSFGLRGTWGRSPLGGGDGTPGELEFFKGLRDGGEKDLRRGHLAEEAAESQPPASTGAERVPISHRRRLFRQFLDPELVLVLFVLRAVAAHQSSERGELLLVVPMHDDPAAAFRSL